jgi:hypothetical protein
MKHQKRQLVTLRGQFTSSSDRLSYKEKFSALQASLGSQSQELGQLQSVCQQLENSCDSACDTSTVDLSVSNSQSESSWDIKREPSGWNCDEEKADGCYRKQMHKNFDLSSNSICSLDSIKQSFGLVGGSQFGQQMPPKVTTDDSYRSNGFSASTLSASLNTYCQRNILPLAFRSSELVNESSHENYLLSDAAQHHQDNIYRDIGNGFAVNSVSLMADVASSSFCGEEEDEEDGSLSYEGTVSDISS